MLNFVMLLNNGSSLYIQTFFLISTMKITLDEPNRKLM